MFQKKMKRLEFNFLYISLMLIDILFTFSTISRYTSILCITFYDILLICIYNIIVMLLEI